MHLLFCTVCAGTVGFSQTMYDVGEGNSVEVCVVVLQGKLMEEVRLHFVTHSGTAGQFYMYMYMYILQVM